MSEDNKQVIDLLISEVRLLRADIKELYGKVETSNKSVDTLKTRFMLVAVTMGLAGGKLSAVLPFLK